MKRLVKHLKRAFWAIVAFAFATIADPMGLSAYTQAGFHQFMLSLEGYSIGDKRHGQKIAVILLDDEFLRASGLSYPVPHWLLADLVSSVALAEPKAIYLHFSFGYDRQDPASEFLGQTLQEVSASIPLFIAAASPQNPEYPILDRLLCPDGSPGCASDTMPFTLVSDIEQPGSSPVLPYSTISTDPSFSRPAPGIACALEHPGGAADCHSKFPHYIDVVWRAPPPICRETPDALEACRNLPSSRLTYAVRSIAKNMLGNWSPVPDPNAQLSLIYPFTTMKFEEALSGGREVENALHDAVVMIGFEGATSGGYAASPNYGPKPAVFREAAALDTLLSTDMKPPPSRNPPREDPLTVPLIYGTVIFLFIAAFHIIVDLLFSSRRSRALMLCMDFVLSVVFGAALLVVHFYLFRVVPASLALVFLSVPISIITDLLVENPTS